MPDELDPATLASQSTSSVDASTPALPSEEVARLATGLDPAWEVTADRIVRTFRFSGFGGAFALATRIALLAETQALAKSLAEGPSFAHGITKTMLHQEWNMSIDQAIEAEAQAQAICMLTQDFTRAYDAFVAKRKPVFEGN